MTAFIQSVLQQDQAAWYHINVLWQNPFLDALMPILRNPFTWAPLYVFFASYIPYRFGKKGFWWCLGFIISFGIADYTSASIIKPLVMRIRPCNDAALQEFIHRLVDCGSGYSFPSSHASNHFALAVFIIITLRKHYSWVWWPALLWAASIAYAQVYVGVHYPLDVLCGAILGTLVGWLVGTIFQKKIGLTL